MTQVNCSNLFPFPSVSYCCSGRTFKRRVKGRELLCTCRRALIWSLTHATIQAPSMCTVIRALEKEKRAHCLVVKGCWNTTGAERYKRISLLICSYLNFKTLFVIFHCFNVSTKKGNKRPPHLISKLQIKVKKMPRARGRRRQRQRLSVVGFSVRLCAVEFGVK